MLDDSTVGDPPAVHVLNGELATGRLGTHERTGMPAAHRHSLDYLVALGDLLMDLEAKVTEGGSQPPHRLPYVLGAGGASRVRWI